MRRLDELLNLYDRLVLAGSDVDGCCSNFRAAAVIKRLHVLCSLVYPEYMKKPSNCPIYLAENGKVMEGGVDIEDTGDMILQFSACYSLVTDYLLSYYRSSPYWRICCDRLGFCGHEEDEDYDETEFVRDHEGCFEEKLLNTFTDRKQEHPLKRFYDSFEDMDKTFVDDAVVLASRLLPHYKKVRERALKVDSRMCGYIDSAERVLTGWMSGDAYSIFEPELEMSYYICADGSAMYADGYGAGVMKAEVSILVAGEVIDRCIMALDRVMHFIPDALKALSPISREVAA